jgi:hypothetical protein
MIPAVLCHATRYSWRVIVVRVLFLHLQTKSWVEQGWISGLLKWVGCAWLLELSTAFHLMASTRCFFETTHKDSRERACMLLDTKTISQKRYHAIRQWRAERESSHNDEDEPSIRVYMYSNFLNNLRTCVSLPCFTRLLFWTCDYP